VTARTAPLGSKYSWLIWLQVGHGTAILTSGWLSAANPLPAHLTVTLTGWVQIQQEKFKITFTWFICFTPCAITG
jgi:hypothetical protein